jgi:hypothetical protein
MNKYQQRFKPIEQRFWEKVDVRGPDECWEWTACTSKGYGDFWSDHHTKAHQYSWVLHRGLIPLGMLVCHTCDNPLCVNPKHLFLGTNSDNIQDCARKGRLNSPLGERHKNHKLTSENVREIRNLYATGEYTGFDLAAKFGVTFQHIFKIVHYQEWKHIT